MPGSYGRCRACPTLCQLETPLIAIRMGTASPVTAGVRMSRRSMPVKSPGEAPAKITAAAHRVHQWQRVAGIHGARRAGRVGLTATCRIHCDDRTGRGWLGARASAGRRVLGWVTGFASPKCSTLARPSGVTIQERLSDLRPGQNRSLSCRLRFARMALHLHRQQGRIRLSGLRQYVD